MYNTLKFVVVLVFIFHISQNVNAFDTGHHWDITASALSFFGFSSGTIKSMQVMNWMVDFYSISFLDKISDFQLLHCDTLRNTTEV